MIILLALAVAGAAPPCAVGGGIGYSASLVAPPPVAAPAPPKPAVVAAPKPKPVAKPKAKRARLSLGCSSHKKG